MQLIKALFMSQEMSCSVSLLHSVLHYFSVIATEDLTSSLTKMKGAEADM